MAKSEENMQLVELTFKSKSSINVIYKDPIIWLANVQISLQMAGQAPVGLLRQVAGTEVYQAAEANLSQQTYLRLSR